MTTTAAHTANPATARPSVRRADTAPSPHVARRLIAITPPTAAAVTRRPQYHPWTPASVSFVRRKLHPPTHGHPGTKTVWTNDRQSMFPKEIASAFTTEPRAASSIDSWVVMIDPYCW